MVETFFEFNLILPFLMNILCNLQPTLPDIRLFGTREITHRMAKEPFNKKKAHSTSKMDFNLMKKHVKFYIERIDCYAAKGWTHWKIDQNYLGSF